MKHLNFLENMRKESALIILSAATINLKILKIALLGFEPRFTAPEAIVLDHYTIGLYQGIK